jgi:predicted nucleic acid-binding protein
MILLDTSGLWAALDRSQVQHAQAARALRATRGPLLLSPFVLAELDYLLSARASRQAAQTLLEDVSMGAYALAPFDRNDVAAARNVISRYADQSIGLADASIVVLAERHGARDVLTLDERHFRALMGPGGKPFRLLPAEWSP